jgi:hypothetical protein
MPSDGKVTVEISREKPSLGSQILTWTLTFIATVFASVGATCGSGKIVSEFSTWNSDGTMVTTSPDRWIILALIVLFIAVVLGAACLIFWIASRTWAQAAQQANEMNIEKMRASKEVDFKT